jgi:thiopurine S-methyltransferase
MRYDKHAMIEPWLERWADGRIGFHEAGGNSALKRHWNATGKRVLVPLCGKSLDLLWLAAMGNEVVGVELSEIAVQAFFAENGLAYEQEQGGRVYRAKARDITIYCMDFLGDDFLAFDGGIFDAHYDRAALIALPLAMRPAYVRKTDALLTHDAYRLVITLEYDASVVDGPPYPVPSAEVTSYWPTLEKIEVSDELANAPPRFRDAGLEVLHEVVWRSPQPWPPVRG